MILLTNEWIGWTANGLRVFEGNLVTSINNHQTAANTQNPSMFQLKTWNREVLNDLHINKKNVYKENLFVAISATKIIFLSQSVTRKYFAHNSAFNKIYFNKSYLYLPYRWNWTQVFTDDVERKIDRKGKLESAAHPSHRIINDHHF